MEKHGNIKGCIRNMTINEIARLAEVSRATVSRYLNNGYVSEEKKERIRKVIEETGYTPSSQAQTLRTKKTKLIGVILPKIHSEAVSRMTAGISEVLMKEGYHLLLANTGNDEKEELHYLNIFAENYVDGVILIATVFTSEHRKRLAALKVPVVILAQRLAGYSCVYQDDFGAARQLCGMLLKKSSHTAYLGVTTKDEAAGLSRKEGYLQAFREMKREPDENLMEEVAFSMEAAYEGMKKLYEKDRKIDGVFCATDNIAFGAMEYLQEIGKKMPEEIRIAGIGDSAVGRLTVPKLTSVHFHYKTSGMEAARILMEMLRGKEDIRRELKMGFSLVKRESV